MLTSKHPFFLDMDPTHVETLLRGAQEQAFEADEIIFREGEPANRFYLINSGEVVLETKCPGDDMLHIETLHGGDVLGWSWLFPPFAWAFQARAAKPTHVVACNGGHLLVTAEEDDRFGHELMRRVARVTIHRLQATHRKLIELQSVLSARTAASTGR
jgi:CRP-like cAMP-binding protein